MKGAEQKPIDTIKVILLHKIYQQKLNIQIYGSHDTLASLLQALKLPLIYAEGYHPRKDANTHSGYRNAVTMRRPNMYTLE